MVFVYHRDRRVRGHDTDGWTGSKERERVCSILIGQSDGSDAYAVATRKGSDDLLKEINAVIKETKDSGKFDQWLKEASTYKQSK